MMNIIITLVVGAVIGWVASMIMKTNAQMGMIANIIVGIIGASIGFWAAGALGLDSSGAFMRWIVAVAGAAILIFLLKGLKIVK